MPRANPRQFPKTFGLFRFRFTLTVSPEEAQPKLEGRAPRPILLQHLSPAVPLWVTERVYVKGPLAKETPPSCCIAIQTWSWVLH